MVSYRQLDQHGIKQVVLHERETTSSGRPKPTHGIEEDADYYYTYTRTGGMERQAKSNFDKYWDFLQHEVIYTNFDLYRSGDCVGTAQQCGAGNVTDNVRRETPATDYEISMGYGRFNIFTISNPTHPDHDPKAIGRGGEFKISVRTRTEFLAKEHFRKLQEAEDEARKLAEEQRLAKLRETARPNPKEVEKIEPIEVEPIKEVAKYSPLMIAGILVIVVILLLKRRRA